MKQFGLVKQDGRTRGESEHIVPSGSIQPHGILFLLKEPEFTILHVSNNTGDILDISPQALLNKRLDTLVEASQLAQLKNSLWQEDLWLINPLKLQVKVREKDYVFFDGIVHRTDAGLILELEPFIREWTSFSHLYQRLQASVAKLQHAPGLLQLLQITAEEMRATSGFDRVMIYQFDKEKNSEVVAEARLSGLPSYPGLRIPASNFPEQVGELSCLDSPHYIADVNCSPAAILPGTQGETGRPLDLRLAVLKSASPLYRAYLRSLDAAASMCFALRQEDTLWGLIACYHQSSKLVPYETRIACEFLAQIASLWLTIKEADAYKMNGESRFAALQQAHQQLETSVYTLVHDLSIPLSIISRFAELLALDNQISSNPQDQSYIKHILEAAKQMKVFISNLLEYPPVGNQTISLKPIALHELLHDLAQELQVLLDGAQAKIFIPEDLPTIGGDPGLLRQIFMNLLSNALTYRRPGIPPQIRVKYKVEPHYVIIGVADNGIGIAPQDYDRIFTMFQRLQNKEQYPGTGIGLVAVKKAAELMDGQVWVESVVGEGSTFWVKLPHSAQDDMVEPFHDTPHNAF
ncbi:MAG TPA: ATP-binding protein [Ktedonobacteraceae bacterium]|jgi:light-regulated signal transduction histidine kinase (bacteriophytochrome)|nr:ATP-binding protein [Ktedonobacteraceae bacterium]